MLAGVSQPSLKKNTLITYQSILTKLTAQFGERDLRSLTPLEIVSKVILRHANLSTTQRYLGTVGDVEAMRWIDNLYG
jgi:hypothetical protein